MNRKARKQARWDACREVDALFEWTAAAAVEGRCPRCEANSEVVPVDVETVPPAFRAQFADGQVEGFMRDVMEHEEDCPLNTASERMAELVQQFGFVARTQELNRMAKDGSEVQQIARFWRVPAKGDPPIAEQFTRS